MIDLQTEIPLSPEIQRALQEAVAATLTQQKHPLDVDLALRITDDAELQALNSAFLGHDAPTDVLSFPSGEVNPETGRPYLGDIVISYPRAVQQAQAGKHALHHELQLLVVHGVLHLLGHDHYDPQEKARMWQAQRAVLDALGCPLSPP